MVCTADELSEWENFPKGLRVLLFDDDTDSAAETKSKLESMDYVVTTFSKVSEAISAISKKPESFHIAIVEVSTSNTNGTFKFLEAAKDLPTIMTSSIQCLSTTMKCIALGAVEFLHKPLSEDKLRNIWQHVVHKAFNEREGNVSESLKPVKESVASMLCFELEWKKTDLEKSEEKVNMVVTDENDPAPSTPQLEQGVRLLDDADCQENANCSTKNVNCSTEDESGDNDVGECKSVETTNCVAEVSLCIGEAERDNDRNVVKEEEEGETADDSKSEYTVPDHRHPDQSKADNKDLCRSVTADNKVSGIKRASGNKTSRKKVDWTPELHKKFVQAVEQLGVDQAIPSRILELMKAEGLTRHNVASHLQKYRMHRRNTLPKEDHERRWFQPKDHQMRRSYSCHPYRPIVAYPPYQSHHQNPSVPAYPVWGVPGSVHLPGVQMWYPPGYPPWQPAESWHWKPPHSMAHGNAWGCPAIPTTNNLCHTSQNEEVIDKVVKEAISKPWLPLPLGLKPPSTESVLSELSRKGISTVPSRINGSRLS